MENCIACKLLRRECPVYSHRGTCPEGSYAKRLVVVDYPIYGPPKDVMVKCGSRDGDETTRRYLLVRINKVFAALLVSDRSRVGGSIGHLVVGMGASMFSKNCAVY